MEGVGVGVDLGLCQGGGLCLAGLGLWPGVLFRTWMGFG